MIRIYLIIFFVFFCCKTFASDTVIVVKDARLDVLSAKQASINKNSPRVVRGYRLQVMTTRKREAAYQLKADLLQRFPDEKTFILYQSPYFKVRFGNFPTREEAEKFKEILSQTYHQGIYVIEDLIEYTPADDPSVEK